MFEQIGDEIMIVEEVRTGTQLAIVKKHYCFAKKLVILGDTNTIINTPLTLIVKYHDWQNNPLTNENQQIYIVLTSQDQTQELILTPTDGKAEFDFISEIPGIFTIRATADKCEPAQIEVVVS